VGPQTGSISSQSLDKVAWLSSPLMGADVASTQDDCWSVHRLSSACLAAKPSHVRADVDGLACRVHQSTPYGW
jgi:hypothetical protein